MYMQPYIIQYPSTFPNCDSLQRPVVTNNNLVKSKFVDSKKSEECEARFKIFTAEVVSLWLNSHSKEEVATITHAIIIGASI